MEHERIGKFPVWLLLVVLGASGVAAYLIFRGKSSSQDSTPTGYSAQGLTVMANPDESATMSLQNQELSLLAEQFGNFQQSMDDQGKQIAQIGDQVGTGFSSINTSLGAISGQVSGVSNQVGQLGNADKAYYDSLLGNLINYANSLSTQVSAGNQQAAQQYQQTMNAIQQMQGAQNYTIAMQQTWFPTLRDWIQTVPYWTTNLQRTGNVNG